MKIARVITTWACPRDCDNCCNKDPGIVEQAKPCSVADLQAEYDQVILTGGEPMLHPVRILNIIKQLRRQTHPNVQKIFLYTAMFTPALHGLVPRLDGVHFTLHYPLRRGDVWGFYRFQNLAQHAGPEKSFRLYIEPRITKPISIIPSAWARVKVKPWLDQYPLPPNEELFQLYGSDR